MNAIDDILQWFASLPTSFAFLLALPFLIAFVCLLKDAVERRCDAHGMERAARAGQRLRHP